VPELKLKLAEGRSVPMEDGSAWPAEGATVEVTLYIRRRLADDDLVAVQDETPADLPKPDPVDPPPPADPDNRKARNGGK
jgi:hypothetical protein